MFNSGMHPDMLNYSRLAESQNLYNTISRFPATPLAIQGGLSGLQAALRSAAMPTGPFSRNLTSATFQLNNTGGFNTGRNVYATGTMRHSMINPSVSLANAGVHHAAYNPYQDSATPTDQRNSAFRPVMGLPNNPIFAGNPNMALVQHMRSSQEEEFVQRSLSVSVQDQRNASLQQMYGNLQQSVINVSPVSKQHSGTVLDLSVPTQSIVNNKTVVVSDPEPGKKGSSDTLVETLKSFLMPQSQEKPANNSDGYSLERCLEGARVVPATSGRARSESNDSLFGQTSFDGTTVLCQVCGDKASGFHYGVHACEGCKGFFRRSIQQKIQYRPCTKNQQCSILRINRNRCQYCRLKKCIAVGMSRDAVRFGRVPKREKAKILAEMQRASAKSQVESLCAELEDEDKLITTVINAHINTCDFTKDRIGPLIASLQHLAGERKPAATACPLNPNPFPGDVNNEELSERYSPAIRGVVDFSKAIPGFQMLSQEDQVTLLKAGMFEVLLLRLAVLFDSESKTLMLLDGSLYRKDVCPMGAITTGYQGKFLVDSLFDFIERFNSMALNDIDMAMYCSIVILSPDRPGLRNRELVEKIHSKLKDSLYKVIQLHHPSEPALFSQLMLKIPDLRTLNTLHQEKLLTFKVDGGVSDRVSQKSAGSCGSSTRTRSPTSETSGEQGSKTQQMEPAGHGTSHWSTVCKASDGSPSASPTPPLGRAAGGTPAEESAHLHTLNISPHIRSSGDIIMNKTSKNTSTLYPSREASSFDSGKGTLSGKGSSCSDSDGEETSGQSALQRALRLRTDMPTLKKALQAPPMATSLVAPAVHKQTHLGVITAPMHDGSVRHKHQAVASLLERRSSNPILAPAVAQASQSGNGWANLSPHAAAFLLSSRAAALSGSLSPSACPIGARKVQSEPRPVMAPYPQRSPVAHRGSLGGALSPAHSGTSYRLSPKRPYTSTETDEQPLNLSKKPAIVSA